MVGAIIVAAGNSSRMNGVNKLFADINGKCVLARTLINFEKCKKIDYIVIVTREDMQVEVKNVINKYSIKKVLDVVIGGATRQESVSNGIRVCPTDTEIIAIHDGARPFINNELIENIIENCKVYGASIPGVKVKDTVKVMNDGFVKDTPNRETLFNVQTPQVFNFKLYKAALDNAIKNNISFTDDSQLFETIGEKVFITPGDYRNIKITTIEDMEIAKAFATSFEMEGKNEN